MKIECYNERNARSCNVRLTNLVETVNAAGINISLPQGAIKLNISPLITHLKFTLHGVQWIVKVTNRVSLGNDLYNISYSIDWLKDYWLKYADNTGHYMVARTTVDALINPMLTDVERSFTTNTTKTTLQGNSIIPTGVTDWEYWTVCVVLNEKRDGSFPLTTMTPSVLIMESMFTWLVFNRAIATNTNLQKAIIGVYAVPKELYTISTGERIDRFSVYGQSDDIVLENPNQSQTTYFCKRHNKTYAEAHIDVQTGLLINKNNWRDIRAASHTLYVPFVGNVPINAMSITNIDTVTYVFDLADGLVSAIINGLENTRTSTAPLPQVSWETSTAPQSYRNIAAQAALAGTMALFSGGAAGLLLGAGGIGAGAIAQLATAEYGAYSTSSASGFYVFYQHEFRLTTITTIPLLTDTEQQTAYGLPAGKPVEHLSDLAPGYYWLDCSNALIYGGTDYEPAYRQALHNVRINVN